MYFVGIYWGSLCSWVDTVACELLCPQVADLLGHLPWYGSSLAVENASYNMGSFFVGAKSLSELNTVADHRSTRQRRGGRSSSFLAGPCSAAVEQRLPPALLPLAPPERLPGPARLRRHRRHDRRLLLPADLLHLPLRPPVAPRLPLRHLRHGLRATVFALLSPHLSAAGSAPTARCSSPGWVLGGCQRLRRRDAFYVSRVPERWRPGRFDLAGHSHQIFHVFVIAGALAHYGAATIFLEFRDEVGCS
uniref:Uncharacterized protein n=1 Tax=Ananas comosus var. bracteatus TaxID=296719 RepID=A0A6V7PLY2_ANACO|nr:unnamed protein product [Ananas comosus var. bracteatus]